MSIWIGQTRLRRSERLDLWLQKRVPLWSRWRWRGWQELGWVEDDE